MKLVPVIPLLFTQCVYIYRPVAIEGALGVEAPPPPPLVIRSGHFNKLLMLIESRDTRAPPLLMRVRAMRTFFFFF